MVLRELAGKIAKDKFVIPIIEPVIFGDSHKLSLKKIRGKNMLFLLIVNPIYGDFSGRSDYLTKTDIGTSLKYYKHWVPTVYINDETTIEEFDKFTRAYPDRKLALIYRNSPKGKLLLRIKKAPIEYHIFLPSTMEGDYIASIPKHRRVEMRDPFDKLKKDRNADYLEEENFFTDLNTRQGNPRNINFGDFSIIGNSPPVPGRTPHAIAIHHIHFAKHSNSLSLTHFVSSRKTGTVDTKGKTKEAIDKLVASFEKLQPSNTTACSEYIQASKARKPEDIPGLGHLKRLAIKHHLETIMSDRGLDLKF